MIKRIVFILSLIVIGSQNLMAGTVSFDQLATSSDLTVAKYNADMNTIFQDHNTNIQSSNILNDTVAEVDMADDANPRIRDYELGGSGTECQMVYSGLLTTTTSGTLTGSVPSGTAYPRGYRIVKSSSTAKTFTASRWTFVDIDINGNFTYSEASIGGSTPSVAPNSIRLSRVSTDGTQIANVQDLRTLSCTSATFDSTKSATSESSVADILKNNTTTGFVRGLVVSRDTATTLKILPGSAYINGRYRSIASNLTVPTTAASPANGTSGIDTGSFAASTNYYVYAIADRDSTVSLDSVISTSSSAPTGVTNYRRIGEISSDASISFVSADPITVSGFGKIVQIKKIEYSTSATGTTTLPADNSIPQITEGDEFMALSFTPINANDKLKIDVNAIAAGSQADTLSMALFQDASLNAIAATAGGGFAASRPNMISLTHYMVAGQTTTTTFKTRIGGTGGTTVTFNGVGGTRLFGGNAASTMTITEYEG